MDARSLISDILYVSLRWGTLITKELKSYTEWTLTPRIADSLDTSLCGAQEKSTVHKEERIMMSCYRTWEKKGENLLLLHHWDYTRRLLPTSSLWGKKAIPYPINCLWYWLILKWKQLHNAETQLSNRWDPCPLSMPLGFILIRLS